MRSQNRWLYAGFVLLALACWPASALAGSAEKVYIPEIPTVESRGAEATPKPTAPTSRNPRPRSTTETTTAPGEAEAKEQHAHGTAPGGKHRPPGGDRGRREGDAAKPSDDAGHTMPVRHMKPATAVEPSAGGGSSPVVPILIVVAVLAAGSIGTVIYRGKVRGR